MRKSRLPFEYVTVKQQLEISPTRLMVHVTHGLRLRARGATILRCGGKGGFLDGPFVAHRLFQTNLFSKRNTNPFQKKSERGQPTNCDIVLACYLWRNRKRNLYLNIGPERLFARCRSFFDPFDDICQMNVVY
jgi:hypothetical protein